MKLKTWATRSLLLWGVLCLVPVLRPQAAALAATQYSIQVAATQDRVAAEKKVGELAKLGHNAFFRQETIQGRGQWYRVYVERFASKAEAEKEARTLKSLGLISDYAVRALGDGQESAESGKTVARPEGSRGRTTAAPAAGAEPAKAGQGRKVAPQDKKSPPGIHYLHVGSYRERENAEKSVQELVRHGQKAFWVEEGPAGGAWFRVYVGEFETEQEARRVGASLREKRWIGYFKVVRLPDGTSSGRPQ